MSKMKDYAIGVCDSHPREMFNLYDLLTGNAPEATEVTRQAIGLLNGRQMRVSEERGTILEEIRAILPRVHKFDKLVILGAINAAASLGDDFMEEELSWWRGRCLA